MKLVRVYSSISINEVYFIKSILESYEIKTEVFDDNLASIAPHYTFAQGGARLMVREQDVERAIDIVKDYESNKKKNFEDS